MTVADDRVHTGQYSNLLRGALGIAAGDEDACGWIFAMDFAQKGARSAIRVRGHTASVGNDYIGLGGVGSGVQAAPAQIGAYAFAVRPAGPTSEVLNVVFCHVASLIK
jgi:hypothetical protein